MQRSDEANSTVPRDNPRPARYVIGRRMIEAEHFDVTVPYLSLFVPLFAGCKRVIDLGCAQGAFLTLLKNAGVEAVGVELDPDLAADAKAHGLDVVCDDAINYLRTTDERFDGVFCSHVIEHLDYETVIDLIENARRLLVNDGRIVLVTPNPESLSSRFGFWRTLDHVRPYYRDTLRAILQHYGFEIRPDAPTGSVWRECRPALTRGGIPEHRSWRLARGLRRLRKVVLASCGLGYAARFLDAPHDTVIVARKRARDRTTDPDDRNTTNVCYRLQSVDQTETHWVQPASAGLSIE